MGGNRTRDAINMINYKGKKAGCLCLFSALFIFFAAVSCERADMYSFASGKHPLVHALTDTDDLTYTKIIKANDEGFYSEHDTGAASGYAYIMDVDKNGTVFLYDGATGIYVITKDGDESSITSPVNVACSASSDEGTFIFSGSTYEIYKYNSNTSSLDLYKTLSSLPYLASVDIDEDIVYFIFSYGGTISIYDIKTLTLQIDPAFSIAPGTSYFERNNGRFYNGKTTSSTSMFINGVQQATLTLPVATSYAVSDDGEVFAAENDGNLAIYRMSGSTFIPVWTFNSTGGSLIIRGMRKGELAVGISGSDASEDGLYVYHYNENKMKKLSSRPVYLMHVR